MEEGHSLFTCHAGLVNFGIPLVLQNRPIGAILLGGVLEEGVIQEKCRRYAREIGLDGDDLLMSIQLIRALSKDQFLIAGKMLRPLIRPFVETIHRYHHLQESADHFMEIIEEKDGLLMIDDLTHIRKSEILIRKSGNEFAIILPEKEETLSYDLAERLREIAARHTKTTITTGVASFSTETKTPEILIERAIYALNKAKKKGRNKTISFTQAMEEEKPEKKRVVITGMGIITPLGMDKDSFWEGICQGRSGVSRIESFDPSSLSVQIAAEVKDFEPSKFMGTKKVKRTGRSSQFAIASAKLAIENAGLDITKENSQRIGVIIGSGMGGLELGEEQHSNIWRKGQRESAPILPRPSLAGLSQVKSL